MPTFNLDDFPPGPRDTYFYEAMWGPLTRAGVVQPTSVMRRGQRDPFRRPKDSQRSMISTTRRSLL